MESRVTDPPNLAADLREHIFRTYLNTPTDELSSCWVMNLEWFNEVRKLDDSRGGLYQPGLSAREYLLGIPIDIREDGGVPHLETPCRNV